MRRWIILAAVAVVTVGSVEACTHDFDQFEPGNGFPPASSSTASSSAGSGTGGFDGPSSSSSVSSSSASTSASSTSASTGGGAGAEDCTNGRDDDGNGAVDCADMACTSGFACVSVPQGWEGPALLYDGPPDQEPACPADYPTATEVGFRDLMNEPAQCTPCACGAPSATCTPSTFIAYGNTACNGQQISFAQPPVGTCAAGTPPTAPHSYRALPPTVRSGTCAPSGGVATVPPLKWGGAGRICTPAELGGGCGDGGRCAPKDAAAPFHAGLCVWSNVLRTCPAGFSDRHVFIRSANDTRGCTTCSCLTPQVTCTATSTIYSDAACGTAVATVPNDGSCVGNAAAGTSLRVATTVTGECMPEGGDPTGTITPTTDRTVVCCAP